MIELLNLLKYFALNIDKLKVIIKTNFGDKKEKLDQTFRL